MLFFSFFFHYGVCYVNSFRPVTGNMLFCTTCHMYRWLAFKPVSWLAFRADELLIWLILYTKDQTVSQALKSKLPGDGISIKTIGVLGLIWVPELGIGKNVQSCKALPQNIMTNPCQAISILLCARLNPVLPQQKT